MAKIRKITGRGTGTREVDDDKSNWAGDSYREEQKKRKDAAGNRTVHTGRGTGTRKLKDLPDPAPRPSTEGRTRITGRGTGSRKSTNKGDSK